MNIYLIGICGTAMGSLAGLFKQMGHFVCGSDSAPYPPMSDKLAQLGIEVKAPYAARNLPAQIDLVIIGNVIRNDNPEVLEIFDRKINYMSLPQAIGEFIIKDRNSFVVAGTHGKTTTTSMLAFCLRFFDPDCGFLIGGIPHDFSNSFELPQSNNFIIEGDEYDTVFYDKVPKFKYYAPKYVILTSIEFDHADIYKDLNAVKKAFEILLEKIPDDGFLVYMFNDENIKEILAKFPNLKAIPYGLGSNLFLENSQYYYGPDKKKLSLKLSGQYNYENASAVITLLKELGYNEEKMISHLEIFNGVKRRLELLGSRNGRLIYEDFAHHPTAVAKTYEALKQKHPDSKVICVFEPRSATSRRKVFQDQYYQVMKNFDAVIIQNAFDQSKIEEENRFSSAELVNRLLANCSVAALCNNNADIIQAVDNFSKANDAVVIMSNGGFNNIYREILDADI